MRARHSSVPEREEASVLREAHSKALFDGDILSRDLTVPVSLAKGDRKV